MKLIVTRTKFLEDRTLGTLTCGDLSMHTLEDQVRADPVASTPENEAKVPGRTAIPPGLYDLIVDFSPHFKRELPHILDVPGFVGVRIHPGNVPADTEGCILVGKAVARDYTLRNSRIAFDELFERLEQAYDEGRDLSIEVINGEDDEPR